MKFVAILPLFLTFALLATGCSDHPAPAVEAGQPGPVPATQQSAGNPELGYEILVNRGYVSCGLPLEAYLASTADREPGPQLAGRTGRSSELPYNLNAAVDPDGVELAVSNCLVCHGGRFDGQLIVGLGNAFADFSQDPRPGVEAMGLYVTDGTAAAAWRRWADRIAAIAPYMVTDTVGVNPAPNLTMALMAYRDPRTLAWHDEPRLAPPPAEPLPTAVPPWWRMRKKHALFYHGGGRGDHVSYMMLKSLVCTDDVEEAGRIAEWFRHVRAYIATLEPPRWPWEVDEALAAEGVLVFEQHCAVCHGSYGESWSYANLIVDLETVGTDPAYALQAIEAKRFIAWFNESFYGANAQARPAAGYVAPPLDAIWATAPYLHNDSVPSLAALLDSRLRPTYWRHLPAPRQYDRHALGWRFEALGHGKEGAADDDEARHIYDTTRHGYGNGGHTFGDALTDHERRALIEYLKTL